MAIPHTSKCCWIIPSQICLGSCAGEIKWILHLHAHALRNFLILEQYQIPYVSNSDWVREYFLFAFAFFFSTTLLFIKWSTSWLEHSYHQNVSFVSLRMICKTIIWCNQILIVKQQWRAVIVTSKIIFHLGIFLVL